MLDTAAPSDTTLATTNLSSASGAMDARYNRPASRGAKEKRYRSLLKAKQTQTPVQLVKYLLGTVQLLRSLDAEARKQHNRDIATFYQYYDCNEYGDFNEAGEWIADAQNTEEFAYSLPLTPAHVDSAKTLLTKVALEYEYKAKNDVSVLDGQLARMCERLAEEEMERIFSDDLRSRERLFLLLAGKSYRCHFWAGNALEPNTVEIPVYENQTAEVPGSRVCGNQECQKPLGKVDVVCPKCLSEEIVSVEGGKTLTMQRKQQTVTLAENQMYVPNPLAVQHDLSKTNINRSFLVERDALPRSEAEFLYCQTFAGKGRGLSEEMTIIRELERSRLRTSQDAQGDSALVKSMFASDTEMVERERAWLEKWRYSNFVITEDYWHVSKLDGLIWCENEADVPANARRVKNGTFLGDIYPNGCFICVVDDVIVEINGSQVSDKWIKLIFGMRPSNTDGSGMQRLRPLADMANDSTNLEFKVLMDDADPKTFLNRAYLSHLAKVGEYSIVDQLKDGDSWDQVVHRLQGATSHPALGMMNDKINAHAQFTVGTFSSMGQGAPDVKAFGTATGVVAMSEEASGRFVEAILQIALADIESRFKVLNNIRKHSIEPQIDDLKKRFGTEVIKRFQTCSLRQTISITKKKGTDQPQSHAIKLAQLQAYGDAASKVAQNPNGDSLLQSFAEMIDMPIHVGIGLADKEEAGRRLGVMREMSQKYNEQRLDREKAVISAVALVAKIIEASEHDVPDVMDMQMQSPVPADMATVPSVVMMQNHPVFMDVYKDWLFTEGARSDNTVLKTVVQMMFKLHYEREILKQTELVRVEAEKGLQVKQMEIEMAARNAPPPPATPSPEEMAAQENAAKEEQMTAEVIGRIADDDAKDADATRKQVEKDEDFSREMLRMDYQNEIEREREVERSNVDSNS